MASLVPSLKIWALVGCATAGILLTLLAYLQSPRPEPLSPAGLWGWFSRPIERNAALRPSAETEGGEYRRAQKEADLQRELRRGYARRYLEKLVQLNVRVPNSDAQQLIGLLDAKRAAPKTGAQRNPADNLKRAGFIGALIVVPTLSIAAYLVAWIHIAPESAPVLDVTSLWQPSAPAAALVAPSTNTNQTVPVGQGGSGSGETPPAQGPNPADSIQSAQPSGSVQSYWPILVLAGLLGYLCYRALDTGESVIPESPAFSTALGDWNGVVVSRQRSPRSVKLFGNLARYTAMMLLEPDERHKVAQQRPRFGPGKKTPTAVDPDRAAAIRESRRRDSIAVALAAIYHVRPDILDRNVSVLGHDWRKALDDVRREDMERYDQRIAEVWALLRSRTGALGADQPTIIPSSDELRAAEAQAMTDPDLREELFRLRSRREAIEDIAAILLKIEAGLKHRYGAWPPPEDILQRFRLFVMGTVQIERPDGQSSA